VEFIKKAQHNSLKGEGFAVQQNCMHMSPTAPETVLRSYVDTDVVLPVQKKIILQPKTSDAHVD